jgi:hypothetical protein
LLDFINEFFTKKIQTDIEISWRGQKIFDNFIEKELTPKDIFEIQQAQGYDVAAWVLYKALREKPAFQNFYSFVDDVKESYSRDNRETLVFIISHNPWVSEKQNYEYQWRLKNIVADAGYDFSVPDIPYRRSIFANAYYYQETLKRYKGRKVLFLTHSLASLEMRWFLEKTLQVDIDVVGWLNISGLLYGTSLPPSSDDWLYSAKRYINGEHPVKPEVSRSNSYCYADLNLPKDFPLVSIVGFTPSKLFSFSESLKSRELKFWGPHDGYVTLADYLRTPGVVWPIWKEGHYINVEGYKNRIQASLHYLSCEANLIRSPHK